MLQASDGLSNITASSLAKDILASHDGDGDGCITQEEYLVWTVSHQLPAHFLQLLFQVHACAAAVFIAELPTTTLLQI